jgi:hypothetical protein
MNLDDEKIWIKFTADATLDITEWKDQTGDVRKSFHPITKYTGYYKKGFYHRSRGPARIWFIKDIDNNPLIEEWYWNGDLIPVKSQQEFEKYLKLKAFW